MTNLNGAPIHLVDLHVFFIRNGFVFQYYHHVGQSILSLCEGIEIISVLSSKLKTDGTRKQTRSYMSEDWGDTEKIFLSS